MYVATSEDKDWLLNAQRKLYARSFENPDYVFEKLWGLVTDLGNLRSAFARVAHNKGARTAGVDGVTVRMIVADGADTFLDGLRSDLRSREYRPSPTRRVRIPKPGKPGETRPLGIPTVRDRVVQAAVKQIMEPIFEADFYPDSNMGKLYAKYAARAPGKRSRKWHDGDVAPFELASLRVSRYRSYWDSRPTFASKPAESPVRNESRTPGLEEGAPESER